MPDDKEQVKVIRRFTEMAETWTIFANSAYQDWANMKYVRKVEGGSGHRSKKEFEGFKRGVYQMSKMYQENAKLCLAVAKELEGGRIGDIKIKKEGGLVSSAKIIAGNFARLKP